MIKWKTYLKELFLTHPPVPLHKAIISKAIIQGKDITQALFQAYLPKTVIELIEELIPSFEYTGENDLRKAKKI